MSDQIKSDDEKFKSLLKKQGQDVEKAKGELEELDDKMDDMMMIQSLSEDPPEFESVEEKYEIELLLEEFGKKMLAGFDNNSSFEDFFPEDDEETP